MSAYRQMSPVILGDAFVHRKKEERRLRAALNCMENGEDERAASILMQLEALCTNAWERFAVFYLRAQCFHVHSQFQMALPLYERALEERDVYEAAEKKAQCLYRLGRLEEALEAYCYAAELDRYTPAPYMRMAHIYMHMRDYEAALDCIDEALFRADDDDCFAHVLAARCHASLGNREAMEDAFRDACACGADAEALAEELKKMAADAEME